jgi:hypothetical protein
VLSHDIYVCQDLVLMQYVVDFRSQSRYLRTPRQEGVPGVVLVEEPDKSTVGDYLSNYQRYVEATLEKDADLSSQFSVARRSDRFPSSLPPSKA